MRKLLLLFLLLPISAQAQDNGRVISQKGRAFRPGEVTITRNESLTFTNEDSFIHQIYVDGLFDSEEKGPGEVLNETFPRAGTFPVRCHIHPTMRLIVHVK
jgi:plastocyanin